MIGAVDVNGDHVSDHEILSPKMSGPESPPIFHRFSLPQADEVLGFCLRPEAGVAEW